VNLDLFELPKPSGNITSHRVFARVIDLINNSTRAWLAPSRRRARIAATYRSTAGSCSRAAASAT
jgi:hypothetical protein